MMEPVKRITKDSPQPMAGNIVWDGKKATWNLSMLTLAIVFGPLTFNSNSFVLFVVLTYTTLLVGHSVGMHRMMIHRTFKANTFVTRCLVYIGVLVGMSGPFSIIRIHDERDWAQRKPNCHDFFSHRKPYLQDVWWQLTSRFEFKQPPTLIIEPEYCNDPFFIFCEKTWRYHQCLLALLLFFLGGWPFVVWGVFVRVAVSIVGHWSITYFCHNPGQQKWRVKNAAVQASNLKGLGLITYGECWHNNHHAFPESAKIGLEKGQWDPAWWFILLLQKLHLVFDVSLPRHKAQWDDLVEVENRH